MNEQRKPLVVLFNGPPGSGKDTAAKHLLRHSNLSIYWAPLAKPLKERTHILLGCKHVRFDAYEDIKDIPHEEFFGYTPRQMYIWMSEEVMKPKFGNDILPRLWGVDYERDKMARAVNPKISVVSDLGFPEELPWFVNYFGPRNIVLIRLHRNGHDFSNDSREYIPMYEAKALGVQSYDMINTGTIHSFGNEVSKVVAQALVARHTATV